VQGQGTRAAPLSYILSEVEGEGEGWPPSRSVRPSGRCLCEESEAASAGASGSLRTKATVRDESEATACAASGHVRVRPSRSERRAAQAERSVSRNCARAVSGAPGEAHAAHAKRGLGVPSPQGRRVRRGGARSGPQLRSAMEAVTERSAERIDKAVAKRGHEVALRKAVGERCRPA